MKPWYDLHKNKQSEQTMSNTTLIKELILPLVECVVRPVKKSYREWILKTCPERMQKKAWHMLLEWFLGNCVRNLNLKSLKNIIYNPQTVSENIYHMLIWDMNIECDNVIVERRPDIVIVDKTEKTAIIIDAAIPGDRRIIDKEKEKTE